MSTTFNSVACDITAVHVDALAEMLGGLHLDEAPAYEDSPPAYCKASEYFKEMPPAYGDIEEPSDEFIHHWVYEWEHVADRLDWLRPELYTDEVGVSYDHLRWLRRWAEFARANPDDQHNYLFRMCDGCVWLESRCRREMGREFYPPGTQPRRPIRREPAASRALPRGEYPMNRDFACSIGDGIRAAQNACREAFLVSVLGETWLIE